MYEFVYVFLFKLHVQIREAIASVVWLASMLTFFFLHSQLAGKLVTDRRKFQMGVVEVHKLFILAPNNMVPILVHNMVKVPCNTSAHVATLLSLNQFHV